MQVDSQYTIVIYFAEPTGIKNQWEMKTNQIDYIISTATQIS